MIKPRDPGGDDNRITVHGPVSNAALVAGRGNAVKVSGKIEQALPPPQAVDFRAELATIATALRQLAGRDAQAPSPHASKIDHALAEAEEEAERPEPDRKEIGRALDRAVEYAKAAGGFADAFTKLEPHLLAAVSWLGEHGAALLRTVGLA